MSLTLSRRMLLKCLGFSAAAAVPIFRTGVLHAQTTPQIPKRFVANVHFCGTIPGQFFPAQSSPDVPLAGMTLPTIFGAARQNSGPRCWSSRGCASRRRFKRVARTHEAW